MSVVAGVDFGTLSVRVSIFDSQKGRLGSGAAEYPLQRKKEDPDHATQKHSDHMDSLVAAMREARDAAGVDGEQIAAIALDTTGSSVVPVGKGLVPLDDYCLWCDHRAWQEAAEITATARAANLDAIEWCGGIYSSEWGFAKLLHWLRKIRRSASVCRPLSNTATWWPQRYAASPSLPRFLAASAPWGTSGCGTGRSADFRRIRFCKLWIRCSPASD